ncbi:glycine cleavage system aminomethyltransferase GcvT [Humitalea sp. 24SJ18S-53]|uniref:glycine cleavage system aminomethyltransferase GcvT n=1 Tax=Humitalea sp. 24SJ18S-53 TaxID=3422307 RepID=UPI003D66F7EE
MADSNETLLHTPLDALHRSLGARMVPFAGYAMPVQYPAGIMAEHNATRTGATLFDVSHMGQAMLAGPGAATALERATPADIQGLKPGRQRYLLLTTDDGGVLDDAMAATVAPDLIFLVLNASRKHLDIPRIASFLPPDVSLTPLPDRALLAFQGPKAAALLAPHAPALAALSFMGIATTTLFGQEVIASRSGYTGEDGYEISVAADGAEDLARALLALDGVMPAGLGARDSLRLEAGLCLYGQDLDETTSAVEAGLVWTIGKRRRTDWDFPGAARVRDEMANGPARRRVGIAIDGRQPARAGTPIHLPDGPQIGVVTSGGFGPAVNRPIAMGYVPPSAAVDGTALHLMVRGKPVPATVAPLPFHPHGYLR